MKSRITMEMDFEINSPYIQITFDHESEDVRDKIIRYFQEKFGHASSWAKVYHSQDSLTPKMLIYPIIPCDLEREASIIQGQVEIQKAFTP